MALAARLLGIRAVVVMPETAPRVKVEGAERLGAEVIFAGTTVLDRKARAESEAAARGLRWCRRSIIRGLSRDRGRAASRLSSSARGFGGLRADGRRWTVLRRFGRGEVAAPDDARDRRRARGRAKDDGVTRRRSSGDARRRRRASPTACSRFVPATSRSRTCRRWSTTSLTVSEREIEAAVKWLFDHANIVAEPSGAASVAAVLRQQDLPTHGRLIADCISAEMSSPED